MRIPFRYRLSTGFLVPVIILASYVSLHSQEGGSLENPTKLMTGSVTSDVGDPLDGGMILVFEDPYPNVVTSSKINSGEGYRLLLDPSKIYTFRIEAPGFFSDEYLISTPEGYDYQEITENFTLHAIPKDSTLFLGEPFRGETAEFTESGIISVIAFLKKNPSVVVTINVGLVEDAVDPVSKARVGAIKKLFTENDLSVTRITWSRDVGQPFNQYGITISGFLSEESEG